MPSTLSPEKLIVDPHSVVSTHHTPDQVKRADDSLRKLRKDSGIHAVACVLDAVQVKPYSSSAFQCQERVDDGASLADSLFHNWSLGVRGFDNGLLLLIIISHDTSDASSLQTEAFTVAGGSLKRTLPPEWRGKVLGTIFHPQIPSDGIALAIEKFGLACSAKAKEEPYGSRASTYLSAIFLALLAALQLRALYERAISQQCQRCGARMRELDALEMDPLLTEQQKFERDLGSATFHVQRCMRCQLQSEVDRAMVPSVVYEQCAFCGTRSCKRRVRQRKEETESQGKVLSEETEYTCEWCGTSASTITTLQLE